MLLYFQRPRLDSDNQVPPDRLRSRGHSQIVTVLPTKDQASLPRCAKRHAGRAPEFVQLGFLRWLRGNGDVAEPFATEVIKALPNVRL
jgi:hypothetical protein